MMFPLWQFADIARRAAMSAIGGKAQAAGSSGNMFYEPSKRNHGLPHDPYNAIVAPRPIGWITSMSTKGEINLAPYSFFNSVSSDPPMVMFASDGRKNTVDFVEPLDVISGLVKAGVFGFIVALMGCYHGFYSRGGAQGVGAATTNAVVSASILILTFNYAITEIFFSQ